MPTIPPSVYPRLRAVRPAVAGLRPRHLAAVPTEPEAEMVPPPLRQLLLTQPASTHGFRYYPSFQPGYRLIDGSDLIALANTLIAPAGVVGGNILNFGGLGDGVTDNTQAFLAALAATGTVIFPPGVFYFASGPIFNLSPGPVAGSAVVISGSGVDSTFILCGGAGWTFNMPSSFNGVTVSNMTFLTPLSGVAVALTFNGTALSDGAMSTLQNLAFYGSSGPGAGLLYWGTAVIVNSGSNFNINDIIVIGCNLTPGGATTYGGIGVNLGASAAQPGLVYNFVNCAYNLLNVGIVYGPYVQGLSVANTNFVCNVGVEVQYNTQGTDQLAVSNSQFGVFVAGGVGVLDQSGNLVDMIIHGNVFILDAANAIGVNAGRSLATCITSNVFELYNSTALGVGISDTPPGATNEIGLVVGNIFKGTGIGMTTATPTELVQGLNFFDRNLSTGIGGNVAGDVGMVVQVLEGSVWTNVKVVAGAPNSGGTGFRTLIIPN